LGSILFDSWLSFAFTGELTEFKQPLFADLNLPALIGDKFSAIKTLLRQLHRQQFPVIRHNSLYRLLQVNFSQISSFLLQ
jgi:hypothetical protein